MPFSPEHKVALFTESNGIELTKTVPVPILLQPLSEPVTVYTVLLVGLTLMDGDIAAGAVQVYVVAPLAVNTAFSPEQIVELFTVIVGDALTDMV